MRHTYPPKKHSHDHSGHRSGRSHSSKFHNRRKGPFRDTRDSSLSNLVTESLDFYPGQQKITTNPESINEPVPSYLPQSPVQHGLSVIVPVYNEIRTIQTVIERIERCGLTIPIEILVTDDCSTDGTEKILEKLAEEGRIHYKRHPKNRGKGAAIRTCIEMIHYDYALIQDADLEYDPKDYEKLLKPLLDERADVVFGSRFIGGDERRILTFWHSMANKILTLFSNMLTDMHLTDMETCYKCFRSDFLKDICLVSDRFGFEPEITAKIKKMGAVVYEVPISYHGRNMIQGKKIGWKDGVAALNHILRFHFSHRVSSQKGFDRLYSLLRGKRMNRYLYKKISPFLGNRILELGAGLGGISQFLINREKLLLTDSNACYLRFLKRKFRGIPNVEVFHCDAETDPFVGLQEGLDTVLMMNVLEHLKDDETPLKEAFDALPEGGRIIVMVPLQKNLMCKMDEHLERYGRYDIPEIQMMIENAGFRMESFQQISRLGTFLWWFSGKLFGKREFSNISMKLYSMLTPLIRIWDAFFPWPTGLQGIIVGRKY